MKQAMLTAYFIVLFSCIFYGLVWTVNKTLEGSRELGYIQGQAACPTPAPAVYQCQ